MTQLARPDYAALPVAVMASVDRAGVAREAVALAGGHAAPGEGWAPEDRFAGRVRAVLADARDIDPATVEAGLEDLAARSEPVVVLMDDRQLDSVAARLLGTNAALLCDPTTVECVAALSLALADDNAILIHDAARDAARLDRLNEEVARIAETLARLSRGDAPPVAPSRNDLLGDRRLDFGGVVGTAPAVGDAAEIRRTIRARRMRGELFGIDGLFEDPAWDMLLDLYAARLEHRQVSVSSLCIAAAVAPTTALRWIGKLIDAGLLERRPDSFDRRRAFIVLTDRAAETMADYVASVKRAGLPLA